MADERPLQGKKIAVIVETQFIPAEIESYRTHLEGLGAAVEFLSRLWGADRQVFFGDAISDLKVAGEQGREPGVEYDEQGIPSRVPVHHLVVTKDLDQANPNEYAAVLVAANYVSVRLRYVEPDRSAGMAPQSAVRMAPAAQFLTKAMGNASIVKGMLCHALWLLTPMPELLRGRRVCCHEVVRADVVNAGADVDPTRDVVVDNDLITGHSAKEATVAGPGGRPPYIQAIVDRLVALSPEAAPPPSWSPAALDSAGDIKKGRKVLVLLSEWGFWGEELVGPLDVFDAAGYEVTFATPTGKRPRALPPSMDPSFMDPPLGRSVTSVSVAQKTKAIDDPSDPRLGNPMSLQALMPELPYWSDPSLIRRMEAYYRARDEAWRDVITPFDAVLIVGGSGPIVDLANNQRVHDVILGFHSQGKPVAAECYGVTCLAFARELEGRKSIIWGKHVTGHCREYDYKDGTGFIGTDFNMGPPPYPLEYILRDATGPDGGYHGNVGHETSVIVDFPFITGRSTPDSYLTGQKLVEVLESGLLRFGW